MNNIEYYNKLSKTFDEVVKESKFFNVKLQDDVYSLKYGWAKVKSFWSYAFYVIEIENEYLTNLKKRVGYNHWGYNTDDKDKLLTKSEAIALGY